MDYFLNGTVETMCLYFFIFYFYNESFKIYFHKVHILSTVILKTFKMSTLFLNMYQ